jgi:hypothetical protein
MKLIPLKQLRSIALVGSIECDVATALRRSLAMHEGFKDNHKVSAPPSITDLIGLSEAEVTAKLTPEQPPATPTDPATADPATAAGTSAATQEQDGESGFDQRAFPTE